MTEKTQQIAELITPPLASLGLVVEGIELLTSPGGALLRVYIDFPADRDPELPPVGIDECEAASREISAQMDVADPITSNYTLEVSTPGIDRPLFNAEQFGRFVGESAKVTLRLPVEGRRRFTGVITGVDGDTLNFEIDGKSFAVHAGNVDKARIAPDWVALGLAPAKDASGRDNRPGKTPSRGKAAGKGTRKSNSKSSHPLQSLDTADAGADVEIE